MKKGIPVLREFFFWEKAPISLIAHIVVIVIALMMKN